MRPTPEEMENVRRLGRDAALFAAVDEPLAYWRKRRDEDHDPIARYYIDAFASARHNIDHVFAATPPAGADLRAALTEIADDMARARDDAGWGSAEWENRIRAALATQPTERGDTDD